MKKICLISLFFSFICSLAADFKDNFRITNNTQEPIVFWLISPGPDIKYLIPTFDKNEEYLKGQKVQSNQWYIQDIDLNNCKILHLLVKYEKNGPPSQFKLSITNPNMNLFFIIKKKGNGFVIETEKGENNIKSKDIGR